MESRLEDLDPELSVDGKSLCPEHAESMAVDQGYYAFQVRIEQLCYQAGGEHSDQAKQCRPGKIRSSTRSRCQIRLPWWGIELPPRY